jgi:hypothetical protein
MDTHDYEVWMKRDMHAELQTGPCSLRLPFKCAIRDLYIIIKPRGMPIRELASNEADPLVTGELWLNRHSREEAQTGFFMRRVVGRRWYGIKDNRLPIYSCLSTALRYPLHVPEASLSLHLTHAICSWN